MATSIQPDAMVRWKSLSGVGLALLILYAVVQFAASIAVPVVLETKGAQGTGNGGVVMARAPEEFMVGTTYDKLYTENPKLDKLLVDSMVGMCSMMMSMAVAVLGIIWFAARRGAAWAPWLVAVSALAWVPYYYVIASDMTALGAPGAQGAAHMTAAFALPAVLGAVLMSVGRRPKQTST